MDQINLSIPPKAEYIMVTRLTTSGIAARAGFSFEDIEDLKMAISEVFNLFDLNSVVQAINIKYLLDGDNLKIQMEIASNNMIDNQFAEMILKSIVDEVKFEETEEGYLINIKKYHQGE